MKESISTITHDNTTIKVDGSHQTDLMYQNTLERFEDNQETTQYHETIQASEKEIITSNHPPRRHVQTFKAKILDWDDSQFSVEVLIDKRNEIYQVRNFSIEMLNKSFKIDHGTLLLIFVFIGNNSQTIEIKKGDGIVKESDFPKSEIVFNSNSKLFKFK